MSKWHARIAKIILKKKKEKRGKDLSFYISKHCDIRVIKTTWYRHGNKQNSKENLEINSSIYGYVVYKRNNDNWMNKILLSVSVG